MKAVGLEAATEETRFGGKAVSLGAALRAGFVVPPGFALDVAFVDAVARGDAGVLAACADLYASLGDRPVAVRSSAVGEDGATASFAGQHATVLNVSSPADVANAVHEVWQSGRTESALAYRARLGVEGEPRVAVVIQRLLNPDCSGVLFTKNPLDGRDERVVEATWGLGEAVVAGLVTPDRFRMQRGGEVVERVAGEKDIEVRAAPSGRTEETPVAPERIHALCLDDPKLAALEALARRCEQHFEGPNDVEFAFEGDQLYLLQRRAITR